MKGARGLLRSPTAWKLSGGFNRCQWRTIARQSQRHLSLQSRTHRRPTARTQISQLTQRRNASSDTAPTGTRLKNFIYGTGIILVTAFGYLYITDTRASIHQWLIVPTLRLLHSDPEEAHHAGIRYIKALYDFNLHPRERSKRDEEVGDLKIEVFGHVLNNPIGTSAGIDKNAEIPSPLFALGPAIVEVGGATPHPQTGNPKPRVFRIPSQNALINRYGLNSEGAEHVAMQLRERVRHYAYANGLGLEPESERQVLDGLADVPPGSLMPGRLLAVQIAKNKTTPDNDINAIANDYVFCVDHLAKYADILVVNVSSPNTPGLRDLQATAPLTAILSAVVDAAKLCPRKTKPAVMVKVSPDEDSDAQIEGICSAVWASGVDGVIVGNTTKKRPDTVPTSYVVPAKDQTALTETGGYSGPQMFGRTLDLVKRYRSRLDQAPVDDSTSTAPSSTPATQSAPRESPTGASAPVSPNSAEASAERDAQRLKPLTDEAAKDSRQPLFKLPERHTSPESLEGSSSSAPTPTAPPPKSTSTSSLAPPPTSPPPKSTSTSSPEQKVIFATGGITNGEQCLEILNAGASVCQTYTAMMYGGVGTVTRMKSEMREAMKRAKSSKTSS
ncbi:Dihydroorotate dehydrogenase (quinone), mitochondrial [Vermiconidia calcicola]|uniref:Dihydroorotate dehydrogenase (Quinone), mitochondrial n=1 Tax=Vermiconidia calcicola TaxID=1690605 RepID=A0ACC3MNG0_9PEZI|nr:Dihydroorotate dehydrogenase (quinone), mitochondrial [Vermiconidia calcicola]